MLKAVSGKLIFLGLSDANLERLKAGQPIAFNGSEIGFPGHTFCILAGATEADILREIDEAFTEAPPYTPSA